MCAFASRAILVVVVVVVVVLVLVLVPSCSSLLLT
jgi:hypothetical protein